MAYKTINNKPLHNKIPGLAKEAKEGKLDRREFLAYSTALGATTATAYGLLGLSAPMAVAEGKKFRLEFALKALAFPRAPSDSAAARARSVSRDTTSRNLL